MNRASGKPAERAAERLIAKVPASADDRRLSQEQLRAQARTDDIVTERRGREHVTAYKQVASKDPALKRLQDWANLDEDRVFEIRYITMAPHPWGVDLSNDSVSWAVHVDCHDSLERAVDLALAEAAEEEA